MKLKQLPQLWNDKKAYLTHSRTSLVPNQGATVPLDWKMLPCRRQQPAWTVTGMAFCSDGEHE